ncbi:thiol reductant ABC exporter subunit CydD [Lentibacillus jeotgali]|uniref:thiol reductant ABC exporter subunit CydD n=1 Tax=Lentibacillus jeotgali TaxID=558169 RepID=UPI0002626445|nr:thiol reductant ABC exporter subunit CydD [Lentibacillus jeotgali]
MDSLRNIAIRYKQQMLALFILSVITAVTVILQAYFLVTIVDRIFLKQQGFSGIIWMLLGLFIILLLRTAATYANGQIGIRMAANVKRTYRKALLHKFAKAPVKQSLEGQSGGKVSVVLDAVDEMDSYFSDYIPQLIKTSIIPIVILMTVFTQHVNTGLIMIMTAPFIPIFMVIIGMQTKNKSEEQQKKLSAFSGSFLDKLQGLTTLKLFGRAKEQQEDIRKSSLSFRDATMEILKIAFMSSFMLELISMLSIGIVALELAIQLIIYEQISFFTAFFLLVLAPEFYSMLKDLGSAFHSGRGSMGAARKVTEELNRSEQQVQWGSRRLPVEIMPAAIRLDHVSFNYGEGQFSLYDITSDIPRCGQIAIAGRSGSGKTTLLHLIAGLLPPSDGKVIVGEKPLSHYIESDWFDHLSYISQQPYIFSGTIAENIAIGGDANASRFQIAHAAEQAGLSGMIQTLDKGYDTPVGEAGRGLSGGEMQRLALARAFLKQPAVILFDEPTTGLDLETERVLQSSMKQLEQNATVITVAHRLHTIKNADKIFFLENGRLIAEGTHNELIKTTPEYQKMVSVQRGVKTE